MQVREGAQEAPYGLEGVEGCHIDCGWCIRGTTCLMQGSAQHGRAGCGGCIRCRVHKRHHVDWKECDRHPADWEGCKAGSTTWVRETVHKHGTAKVGTIYGVLQVLSISETKTLLTNNGLSSIIIIGHWGEKNTAPSNTVLFRVLVQSEKNLLLSYKRLNSKIL